MMAYLSAIVTAISMATFFGIVWWACSRGRQGANSESAMLPFALPDEFGPAQQ
ncbi:CcoQ/FixQ family Cbb3-type cytochrome c oxidase assembly chaperone, partial [Achromobacter xylosoxidans]